MNKKIWRVFPRLAVLFVGIFLASIVSATPPTNKYMPGETIAPTCNPLTTNCTVMPGAIAGANSDITSLTGLTTPLSVSQGGIGAATLDTSIVPENGNLYFTTTRTDDRITAQKGITNGIASLDGGGKIPLAQIPASLVGAVTYQGVWNATTNTPSITSGVGTKGNYYVVYAAGTTNIDGINDWEVGEWIIFNGSTWDEVDNGAGVDSVNGHVGAVTLAPSDLGLGNVENTALSTWTGSSTLVTLGTILSGIWHGTAIDVAHGGTGLTSIAANSLLYSPSSNTIGALVAGTNGQVLKMTGGVPTWGTDTTGSTSFTAGTGINSVSLTGNTIAVDESALTLGNIGGTLPVAKGGTGQTTLGAFLTALLPTQTSNSGKFLTTDGSGNISWGSASVGGGVWGAITGTLADQSDLSLALSTKEPIITAGTTSQYWRGDKSWQTLDKSAIGLGSVENTALSTWAGSTALTTLGTIGTGTWNGTAIGITKGGTGATSATGALNAFLPSQTSNSGKYLTTDGSGTVTWGTPSAGSSTWGSITGTLSSQSDLNTALSAKEPTITAGTTSQYWRGDKSWQTLNATSVGLGNVENTALSTWAGSSNLTTVGTLSAATISGTTTTGHIKGGGSTPGIAASTGAGTSPTISILGTDTAGSITLTSGTLPSVSATIATVTFATAYGTAPYIMLTPANAITAALSGATAAYAATSGTTNFTVAAGTGGITALTTYKWNYFVIQ